jgi:hypothetical protein
MTCLIKWRADPRARNECRVELSIVWRPIQFRRRHLRQQLAYAEVILRTSNSCAFTTETCQPRLASTFASIVADEGAIGPTIMRLSRFINQSLCCALKPVHSLSRLCVHSKRTKRSRRFCPGQFQKAGGPSNLALGPILGKDLGPPKVEPTRQPSLHSESSLKTQRQIVHASTGAFVWPDTLYLDVNHIIDAHLSCFQSWSCTRQLILSKHWHQQPLSNDTFRAQANDI